MDGEPCLRRDLRSPSQQSKSQESNPSLRLLQIAATNCRRYSELGLLPKNATVYNFLATKLIDPALVDRVIAIHGSSKCTGNTNRRVGIVAEIAIPSIICPLSGQRETRREQTTGFGKLDVLPVACRFWSTPSNWRYAITWSKLPKNAQFRALSHSHSMVDIEILITMRALQSNSCFIIQPMLSGRSITLNSTKSVISSPRKWNKTSNRNPAS